MLDRREAGERAIERCPARAIDLDRGQVAAKAGDKVAYVSSRHGHDGSSSLLTASPATDAPRARTQTSLLPLGAPSSLDFRQCEAPTRAAGAFGRSIVNTAAPAIVYLATSSLAPAIGLPPRSAAAQGSGVLTSVKECSSRPSSLTPSIPPSPTLFMIGEAVSLAHINQVETKARIAQPAAPMPP
jgi:hypothetical protein